MTSSPRPLLRPLAPVGRNDATGAPPVEKSYVWIGPSPRPALFATISGPEAMAPEPKTSETVTVSKPRRSERTSKSPEIDRGPDDKCLIETSRLVLWDREA